MKQNINNTVKRGSRDLRSRTLVAAFWSLIGGGGRGVIRFTSNLILTRLLFPEAFGQIATAMIIMTLVQVFTDTGIKTALVQNPRGNTPEFIDAAFIIALVRSLILFGLLMIVIHPFSLLYEQPVLKPLLFIMSFSLLVEGFINPALPLLIKSLRIQRQVLYSVGSQFAGFIATLILVYFFRSVIALAVGFLFTSIFRVAASYLVISYRPKISWDREAGAELFHFGKYIILNTMIGWAVLNIDRMIIGKVLDMEQLAYYSIAVYIGIFISEVLSQVFAQSYFPAVSSLAGDLQKVQSVYKKTIGLIISIMAPALMLIVLFSQDIIAILYDPRYQLAGTALFWIALKSLVGVVSDIQSGTLLAMGKPVYITTINTLGLILLAFLLPVMTANYGIVGCGVTVLGITLFLSWLQAAALVLFLDFQPWVIVEPWLKLFGFTALMSLSYFAVSTSITNLNPPVFVFMTIMGFVALSIITLFNRRFVEDLQVFSLSRKAA